MIGRRALRAALVVLTALLAGGCDLRAGSVADPRQAPVVPQAPLGAGAACPRPDAPLDRVLFDRLQGRGAELSCGNRVQGLLHFPGPAADPLAPFEALAGQIRGARREVLLANMVWDRGEGAPGAVLADALAELRRRVRAHPDAYPQGVTVRVLLGNSVRFDRPLDPTRNAFNAAADLRRAGLPLTGAPEPGWRLDVANYRYVFPHSHMKLLVVDGRSVTAGGFNVSSLHLPGSAPGGADVQDLGLWVEGPVAQQAAAAFRDAWQSSLALTCVGPGVGDASLTAGLSDRDCRLGAPVAPDPPVVASASPAGEARVYGLYRRPGFTGADEAFTALLEAAQSSIDLLQSQVSGTVTCDLSLTAPGGCPLDAEGLPVWQAVAAVIRERRVRVRLVVDRAPALQLEVLSMLGGLYGALPPGARGCLSVRWSARRLHTKAVIVDRAMTVVGSRNLHFSSFGDRGLTEYDLATSDAGAIGAVQATFDAEWQAAQPLTLPWWLRLAAEPSC